MRFDLIDCLFVHIGRPLNGHNFNKSVLLLMGSLDKTFLGWILVHPKESEFLLVRSDRLQLTFWVSRISLTCMHSQFEQFCYFLSICLAWWLDANTSCLMFRWPLLRPILELVSKHIGMVAFSFLSLYKYLLFP